MREAGSIAQVSVVVATPVNADGKRELLGIDVGASADGGCWLAFLPCGVSPHPRVACGVSPRSRVGCRTHFMRKLLTRVPKSAEALVATGVRTISQQPSAAEVHAWRARVVEQLEARFPEAAAMLDEAAPEVLPFTACPVAHWPAGLIHQPAGVPRPASAHAPGAGTRPRASPPGGMDACEVTFLLRTR